MQTNNKNNIFKNPSIIRGVFCLCLFIISVNIIAQPELRFKQIKKNFGFVKKGEQVKIVFEFTNSGNEPLLILDAKAECSCTLVEFSKMPILANETSEIVVLFDTKTVYDRQDRIVEVNSNAKNKLQIIRFKGVVLSK